MDNKKWYKRISTCFWFMLATLPILLSLFGYIGQFLGHVLIDTGVTIPYNQYSTYLVEMQTYFIDFTPIWLKNMFIDLFNLIDDQMYTTFAYLMAWFTWVYMLELMVDFIVWLPRWFHNILDKGVSKI